MDKLFLLDAYALIYRSYYAFMKAPRINSKGLNTSCVMGFCNTLNEILTKEKPTHIAVAFDHGKTFRHEAFPAYKAQREETPEDIKLSVPIIKSILEAYHIPILQVDGFEADDIIGTVALKAGERVSKPICLLLTRTMRSWFVTMFSCSDLAMEVGTKSSELKRLKKNTASLPHSRSSTSWH